MKREVDNRTILDRFAKEFADIVENHAKYVIVSGFVAIAHGRSRGTEDIDMIIERIPESRFITIHKELINKGFRCMQSEDPAVIYNDYLAENLCVRYTREGEFLPEMELKLAKDRLDEHQLENRKKLPMTGLDIYFSGIEMNIAFKEELLKSDKDMEDARHLRIVYEDEIDEQEIRSIKKEIRELRLSERQKP